MRNGLLGFNEPARDRKSHRTHAGARRRICAVCGDGGGLARRGGLDIFLRNATVGSGAHDPGQVDAELFSEPSCDRADMGFAIGGSRGRCRGGHRCGWRQVGRLKGRVSRTEPSDEGIDVGFTDRRLGIHGEQRTYRKCFARAGDDAAQSAFHGRLDRVDDLVGLHVEQRSRLVEVLPELGMPVGNRAFLHLDAPLRHRHWENRGHHATPSRPV